MFRWPCWEHLGTGEATCSSQDPGVTRGCSFISCGFPHTVRASLHRAANPSCLCHSGLKLWLMSLNPPETPDARYSPAAQGEWPT